jgi:ATP-dependent helicase HrpB
VSRSLPVRAVEPAVIDALRSASSFVLQAEPGAGKTTRIPVAILEAGVVEGEIVVAQPRRLAARMAASRVASTLHERVGERVGYQVRFDTKVGPSTRIRFVTEGILARRLRDDPQLRGVGLVILDEFHERHIDADVCLALLRRLQRGARPDLRIGVMSATLQPEPVAAFLGAPALACPGRVHPVEIAYRPEGSDRGIARHVAAALRSIAPVDGSVLVFLPGAREIRDAHEACESLAAQLGLELRSLHGELPAADQDRAVAPGSKKLILATNVAETSITIEGVVAVIDSGLARQPSHNPWTGIPTLQLGKISRASAEQRAGRAGRTGPGRCVRLYAQHDFDRRPAFDEPELHRLDLAGAMLDLRAAGVPPSEVEWFEPPPRAAVEAAEALLRRLGAVDDALTDIGRAMVRYPTHPRVARLLVEASARGIGELGAGAAALLSERSIRRSDEALHDRVAAADVIVDLEDLATLRSDRGAARRLGLDGGAVRMVERARDQLLRLVPRSRKPPDDPEWALCESLLVAFPDRVGSLRPRTDGGREIVFASGGSAELAPECVVREGELAVALAVEERRTGTRTRTLVRSAAQIEADMILEHFTDEIEERTNVVFDERTESVVVRSELAFGGLVLERKETREVSPRTAAVLREAALARGPAHFVDDPNALVALTTRTRFAAAHDPTIPALDDDAIRAKLAELCEGARSFADLRRADLLAHLHASVPNAIDRLAPRDVALPGGRRLRVHYESDRPPWVESRLQDFFGMTTGPTIAGVPLVLHLLAPNQRAVQVTTDLAGFWSRHYPDLRRTLMRRYPKHAWPEDPATAKPPAPRR